MEISTIHKKLTNAAQSRLLTGLPVLPDGRRLLQYSIKFDNTLPLCWLSSQSIYPKAYFQSREKEMEWAGCGAAELHAIGNMSPEAFVRSLEARLQSLPESRYFCALPFQQKASQSNGWKPFEQTTAFLPTVECIRNRSNVTLTCTQFLKPGLEHQWMNEIDSTIHQINSEIELDPLTKKVNTPMIHSSEKKQWVKILRKVIDDIDNATIEKVVLARKLLLEFDGPIEPLSVMPWFQNMKSPAYYFCFEPAPNSAFIGSSPERLFKRHENRIWSEALAGTRKRGETPEQDAALRESLLTTHKDLHEQALVFNHINRALQPLCSELQYADRPEVLRLIKVQHLRSTFHGTLQNKVTHAQLMGALHPTPAVAGVPTQSALQVISASEGFDRGLFAGPLGLLGKQSADFTVAIRSGRLNRQKLTLYAGAGVVEGSDPISEWSEIDNKFLNFLQVLKICRC